MIRRASSRCRWVTTSTDRDARWHSDGMLARRASTAQSMKDQATALDLTSSLLLFTYHHQYTSSISLSMIIRLLITLYKNKIPVVLHVCCFLYSCKQWHVNVTRSSAVAKRPCDCCVGQCNWETIFCRHCRSIINHYRAIEFGEITQNNGYYAVQGHSRWYQSKARMPLLISD